MSRKLLFTILAAGLLLTACGPARRLEPVSEPIALTDGLGREVTLQAPAQKVVSLTAATTEILFAVGAGAQVVGRDMFSDYPAEAQSIPDVGGWMGEYSLETIVALQPDLVLAGEINPPELVASLEDLDLTVYYLANPTTIEEMYVALEVIGQLTGHQAEAVTLVGTLQARVSAVDAKITSVTEQPTVFLELDATDPSKPFTPGQGSFVDALITRAGGINIGAQLQGEWAQISIEELIVEDPDMIILVDARYGETPEKVTQRPGWEVLKAVQAGTVFAFNDDLIVRPGPRWVDGLEALACLLHPELFE